MSLFGKRNGTKKISRAIGRFVSIRNKLAKGVALHDKRIERAQVEIVERHEEVRLLSADRERANRVINQLDAFIA